MASEELTPLKETHIMRLHPENIDKMQSQLTGRPIPTWILVADDKVAKIFTMSGKEVQFLKLLKPSQTNDVKDFSNQSFGRHGGPGGDHGGPGGPGMHQTFEPRMNQWREANLIFAREICAELEKEARQKTFHRLVIAATPHVLGDLRSCLGREAAGLLVAEIDKELIHMRDDGIRKEVSAILPGPEYDTRRNS
jgi:protein required for attachment to host cells